MAKSLAECARIHSTGCASPVRVEEPLVVGTESVLPRPLNRDG